MWGWSGPGEVLPADGQLEVVFDDTQADLTVKAQAGPGGDPVSLAGEGELLLVDSGGGQKGGVHPPEEPAGAVSPLSLMTAERLLMVWAPPWVAPQPMEMTQQRASPGPVRKAEGIFL